MPMSDHMPANVWGLPPDLAAAWRQHCGLVFDTLDHAAKAYPGLFERESWFPRAMACLEQARRR
jgi:hypothetical protein